MIATVDAVGRPQRPTAVTPPRRVTLIPGDGIGPDVIAAARDVLDAVDSQITWDVQLAGQAAVQRMGTALPNEVVESVRRNGVALKGPTATSTHGERSVSVRLREQLDLYAGVRPCRALTGTRIAVPGTDLVVIRMTHQDLYAGFEFEPGDPRVGAIAAWTATEGRPRIPQDSGVSLKYLSPDAVRRLLHFAFGWARTAERRRVTIVHKATVMRATDGLFLSIGRETARAYPDLDVDDVQIDALCLALVRDPSPYDVLVMPVQYGDIVSDLAAGLVGGVGIVPGANIGDQAAVFEPVHGTAPRLAGLDRANPIAMVLTGAMLLRHIGLATAADRVEDAVAILVRRGRPLTYDLVGRGVASPQAASTRLVADTLIAILEQGPMFASEVATSAR